MILDFSEWTQDRYIEKIAQQLGAGGLAVMFQPFIYAADFPVIVAGDRTETITNISADSDFLITHTAFGPGGSLAGAPGNLLPLAEVQVHFPTGRSLTNGSTLVNQIFGSGQRPHEWVKPYLIPAGGQIRTVVVDDVNGGGGVIGFPIRFSYIGLKIRHSAGRAGGIQ